MNPETSLHLRPLTRNRLIIFVGVVCALLTTLATSTRGWFGLVSLSNSSVALSQSDPKSAPLIVEQLTLRPEGFYPAALSRGKGRFLLAVNNRAGLQDMNISLSRETSSSGRERLKNISVSRKHLDWNEEFDLPPGTYVVTEASNPRWVCRITVTQN